MSGNAEDRRWLRHQSRLARPGTLRLAALGLAATGCGIVQAGCIAALVGPVLAGHAVTRVAAWAAAFIAAAVVRAGLGIVADGQAFEAGVTARRRLRTAFLVSAFAAGPHGAPTMASGLVTAVDQVEALETYFGRWLAGAVLAWAGPALVLLAVLPVDPVAAAIMGAGGLAVPIGMAVAGLGAAAASRQHFAAMMRLQARFLDRVQGIATIVLAGQAEAEAIRLSNAARDLARHTMCVLRIAFMSSSVLDAAAACVLIVLALRAGAEWRAGTLDAVAAVFTLVLVMEFFAPLRAFAAAYQDRIRAGTAAASLRPAEGHAASPAQAAGVRTVAANGVSLAFENVGFTWDEARGPALEHLSFRVPAEETAILVGPSGAGKSTVLELLLGFVQPQTGRITLNGADLRDVTPAALSRIIAWIGQRPVLFSGTIRDNIRFGREDASDDEVADAVRSAGLDGVAATLPQGLDTPIGEGGYGLSGGQAQRVAIARAFLRQAPLLLLDEPTAHLDPATEADVLDRLRRLAVGRTVLMTAHSSAARAFGGRWIELDRGRLVAAQGAA